MDAKTQSERDTLHFADSLQAIKEFVQCYFPLIAIQWRQPLCATRRTRIRGIKSFVKWVRNASFTPVVSAVKLNFSQIIGLDKNSFFSRHLFPRFDFPATFFTCLTTLGWNRCFSNSLLVMSFGCFFFFGMVTL